MEKGFQAFQSGQVCMMLTLCALLRQSKGREGQEVLKIALVDLSRIIYGVHQLLAFKIVYLILPLILILQACSSASPIQEVGVSQSGFSGAVFEGKLTEVSQNESSLTEYRVFQHGDSGFERMSSVRYQAESRANTFCDQRNMAARTIRERAAVPPYILGNFPRLELIFVCEPSTLNVNSSGDGSSKWSQLEALANLRDRGIITEQEFLQQKEKIMQLD